jgi:hypothetical protein
VVRAAFDELGERLSRQFPDEYHAQHYPYIAHGCGFADGYPAILFTDHEQVLVTEQGNELLSHVPHDPRLGQTGSRRAISLLSCWALRHSCMTTSSA